MSDRVFGDLRLLADWLTRASVRPAETPGRSDAGIAPTLHRLGRAAVPVLGRALRDGTPPRREAARRALALTAARDAECRARVIAELRAVTLEAAAVGDDAKVCALGLLHELGERAAARFSDPTAIQRRSAKALAEQLLTAADVAVAADLMLRQLSTADLLEMVEVMAQDAPAAAARLAAELHGRLDAPLAVREAVASAAHGAEPFPAGPRRRAGHVAVLVDAAARLVVIVSRKIVGERRWRRWAVLVNAAGRVDECLYADDVTEPDGASLVARCVADGYSVASHDHDRARDIVIAAARASGAAAPAGASRPLGASFYLGRDLLDLGDAHLGGRSAAPFAATAVGRAVDLLAGGDPARAHALLAKHAPHLESADAAAATAACLLAQGHPQDALAPLARAIELEPEWPLHHWNQAAALHALAPPGAFDAALPHALRRFLATSAVPSALDGDPDQARRVALAERLVADLDRAARLVATPQRRSRRRRARPLATS